MASHHQALWWVPAGTLPTVPEAMARVALLDAHGPGPEAFTFARRFDPPGEPDGATGGVAGDARDVCRV
jgi:Domain of unknown function (DUF3291)